jgi:hypothetical protein
MNYLKQNSKKFALLENLTEAELDQLTEVVDEQDLTDLIKHNINQENIYRILHLYDFYQYIDITFIEKIQFMILDRKLTIEYDKLNKEDLYNSIFCNDCLRNRKILCDLEQNIHDVICVKYLIKNNHKIYNNSINFAVENGYIRTIKYLHELGYRCHEHALNRSAENGQIETLKYLHGMRYKGNEYAINLAARNGHLEIIKYLHKLGYKGDEWAIIWAGGFEHIEIVKYLLENNYNFIQFAITCARTNEIKQLLKDNIHLLKNNN